MKKIMFYATGISMVLVATALMTGCP